MMRPSDEVHGPALNIGNTNRILHGRGVRQVCPTRGPAGGRGSSVVEPSAGYAYQLIIHHLNHLHEDLS